jgi:acyl transferase domain-containing protein/NAD(P)-dependent dehydrogenase (short-subunit alcohol dehydrogenase family)/acyl carrier protein
MTTDALYDRISRLSPKRLTLLALELQQKLDAIQGLESPDIAAIGMACRFPGSVHDPEEFWALLHEGRDAIAEVPPDRWDVSALYHPDPDHPGTMSTRFGGFLDEVDRFDADFFGIAPREAVAMDPQQRLFLEVCWEALEDAAIAPDSLGGSPTGVFAGICNSDYWLQALSAGGRALNAYVASGNSHSVASGRVSYALGLQGPSVSIDTACSSSLIAVHLACQSLRTGETSLAIAGGVNLILSPETTIALSKSRMMAPDGRCKTFDAAADGFVRSEGCGVVVLKRLREALQSGDRIYGVIRGTAANQDGRSNGLTAPNGPSQVEVIRQALRLSGVRAEEIQYVEAHGTGTSLGDPIELRALGEVLARNRTDNNPLIVGSVKTNIGHLEGAAGIAGLMKVLLALTHEEIPKHLHLKTRNPHIAWDEYHVDVPASARPWPSGPVPRRAGVSSFGFSGTNVHVVVEEAPRREDRPSAKPPTAHLLPLSGSTPAALRDCARKLDEFLRRNPRIPLQDVCFTAGHGRAHLSHRAAVIAHGEEEIHRGLEMLAECSDPSSLIIGELSEPNASRIVFLFTGQGSQYAPAGKELYETCPVFRDALERCAAIIDPLLGRPLREILHPGHDGDEDLIHDARYTQPALFALEYALAQMWMSWGVVPSAVVGHSMGEYAAACISGIFSLDDAAALVVRRGNLVASQPRAGAMVAIFATHDAVTDAIGFLSDKISIAAVNSPETVIISGDGQAVGDICAHFASKGIGFQPLPVSHAYHSPMMDPVLGPFGDAASRASFSEPVIPILSNRTGRFARAGEMSSPQYWTRHLREPVQFMDSIRTLVADGYRTFVEVGPGTTLLGLAKKCWDDPAALFVQSMRKGKEEWAEVLTGLARLYVVGVHVDWKALSAPSHPVRVALPTYPFQRQRFWLDSPVGSDASHLRLHGQPALSSGMLTGNRLDGPVPSFEFTLDTRSQSYLADHRVYGDLLVPVPVFLAVIDDSARTLLGTTAVQIEGLVFHRPLALEPETPCKIQVVFAGREAGARDVQVFVQETKRDGKVAWEVVVAGTVRRAVYPPSPEESPVVPEITSDSQDSRIRKEGQELYRQLADRGVVFGPAFRTVRTVEGVPGQVDGIIGSEPESDMGHLTAGGIIYPPLFDAVFHVLGAAIPGGISSSDSDAAYLVSALDQCSVLGEISGVLKVSARLRAHSGKNAPSYIGDVTVSTLAGTVVAILKGVLLVRTTSETLIRHRRGLRRDWLYEICWEEKAAVAGPEHPAVSRARLLSDIDIHFLKGRFAQLSKEHGLAEYDHWMPLLDTVASSFVCSTLLESGVPLDRGGYFSIEEALKAVGVVQRYYRLYARLLEMLEADGILKRDAEAYHVVAPVIRDTLNRKRAEILEQLIPDHVEARILARCGVALGQVLRGKQDPVQLLFPEGSFEDADRMYRDSPFARVYNTVLAEMVGRGLPEGKGEGKIRLLEVGAGTGGTTAALLAALHMRQMNYLFTDISPLFLRRAMDRFRENVGMRYMLFDIEKDAFTQGLQAASFDVIVAANVVHATKEIKRTLFNLLKLIRSDGGLVLLEGMWSERWVDLTFGLTEGWWKFVDTDLRPRHPLLSGEAWMSVLRELGCQDPVLLTAGDGGRSRLSQQALIYSRAPSAHSGRSDTRSVRRHWLIFSDRGGVGERLASQAREHGDLAFVVSLENSDGVNTSGSAPGTGFPERDTIHSYFKEAFPPNGVREAHCVYLWPLDVGAEEAAHDSVLVDARVVSIPFRIMQVVGGLADLPLRLWMVTRGGQAVNPEDPNLSPRQGIVWGLGRGFSVEHPGLAGGLIDVDSANDSATIADRIYGEVVHTDGEDQIAFRGGKRFVPRLTRMNLRQIPPVRIRADATYLITGGFGVLGRAVALRLAERGARHITLMSRRTSEQDADRELLNRMGQLGVHVECVTGDVADPRSVGALKARFGADLPCLKGIVHAAVAMSTADIEDMVEEDLLSMMRAKVEGTATLLDGIGDLDFAVLCSSTTSLLGARGLAHYAAANQFIDQFAHRMWREGKKIMAVNWGLWENTEPEVQNPDIRTSGLHPMDPRSALDLLEAALADPRPQVTIASVDWGILRPLYESRRKRPLLEKTSSPTQTISSAHDADSVTSIADAAPHHREELLRDAIRREVARVLGVDQQATIDGRRGLFEMGMDSLMSVDLKARLERLTGKALPSTLTFNYPTIDALTLFIGRDVFGWSTPEKRPGSPAPQSPDIASTNPHAGLSEDELATLLRKKLDGL